MECVSCQIPDSQIQLATARVAVSFLSNMECVNLLGQGRPVSQIQLATARVPVSFLSNMECVNLLFQGRPGSQNTTGNTPGGCLLPIKYGMRQPSRPG
ncbi:hypothetical protein CEXT_413711 [Caerostris extrusa]|uniref:Uncharacterized protein n=1 Tax=Caerostris extrusa TaxID=172846 RepID=A0AAV4NEA9_CAEEX|nr:hypothetical protein CEXT_413711 [Caerostris extrusa]